MALKQIKSHGQLVVVGASLGQQLLRFGDEP